MEKPLNVELAGKGGSVWSPPRKDGKKIFFTAMDGHIYCITTEGDILWTFRTNDRIICSPTIDNGTVYAASMDGYLYALTYEGKFLWKYHVGDHCYSTPAVRNGTIFVGSTNGTVHAVSAEGKRIWMFKAGDEIGTGISPMSNRIVFGSYDENVYCLNFDGELLWKCRTGGAVTSFGYPLMTLKDAVFVPSSNLQLYAIGHDGDIRWKFRVNENYFHRLHENMIYLSKSDGEIICLDLKGNIAWQFNPLKVRLSGTAMDRGTIYTSSVTGHMLSIDTGEMTVKKEYIGDYIVDMIIDNGVVYGGSNLCYFYAIDAKDLSIIWKFTTSNPRPAEWRKVGFEPKAEKEKEAVYERREIELKTTRYGAQKHAEQIFQGTYSPGMTTYFSSSPYATQMEYGSRKKKRP